MNHILKLLMYFFFCVCVDVYTTFMSGAHEVQKEHLDPLGLDLKMVVCHHVNAGNRTPVFWVSNSQCFNHQAIFLAL